MFVNVIIFLNVLLFWFPADQGLKKVGFNKKKIKLVKILYDSEISKLFFYNFILNNHVSAIHFRKKITDLLASWC